MITGNEVAFPFQYKGKDEFGWDAVKYGYGMTLRQYYVGLAMQGLCANSIPGPEQQPARIVRDAIAITDLLIEALNKNK